MRVTLFKKGLLLLLIPVMVQLTAIFILASKYEQVLHDLKYQLAVINIGKTFAEAGEITMQMSEYLLKDSKDPNMQSYGPALESYGRLSGKLDEMCSTTSEFEDIDNCAKKLGEITREHMARFGDNVIDFGAKSNDSWYVNTLNSLYRDMAPYKKWLYERPASKALSQFNSATITNTILILIAVNIATSFLLWWVINVSIVRQVDHLKENFERLAHNQPLLKPLEGSDEVADFDRAFHEIGSRVERLRKERTEYLEIMNSTMREPLQKLQGTLELIQERPGESLSERGRLKLEASSRTINRLITMLNELIDFEQIDQGTFKLNVREAAAAKIISDAFECIFDRASGAGITIKQSETELIVDADPDRLVQVIVNLLTNAIKFSPRGTTVTVGIYELGPDYVFYVQDQGPGIPVEMQSKVFERFEQVDQQRDSISKKGTGLGLAICKTIVEAHGGRIWVESVPGDGATFKFSIPVAADT
ncbi:HAMP domain-containing histidine kinase [Candidatus Obscuribacterales bacterium]|nr:HAMP domain-containing histidine kinase [Candidatus Obscuribacterales bacterium]